MLPQPDDTTCGPTCLQAVYAYHGDDVPLQDLINEVPKLKTGGTLGVLLGIDALRRGYHATLYTYNLHVFDPTWFDLPPEDLVERLAEQARVKHSSKLRTACRGYMRFLRLGGQLKFDVLRPSLLRRYLNQNLPILTGLSSTYLYQSIREHGEHDLEDDVRGFPQGHFVVLCGYDRKKRNVLVADPLESNPHSPSRRYSVSLDRVLASILLGVLTYDGNLLVIEKPATPADAPTVLSPHA